MYVRKPLKRRPLRKAKKTTKRKPMAKRSSRMGSKSSMVKTSFIRVKNDGINATYDHFFNKKNAFMTKMSKTYAAATPIIYEHVSPTQLQVLSGVQAYTSFTHYSVADLQNISYVAGNTTLASPTINNTARIFNMRCIAEYRMTNSSNSQCNVDCYMFRVKRDSDYSLISLWTTGLADMYGATTPNPTAYGMNPLDVQAVKSFFTCVRKTSVTLQPGQSHTQRYTKHKYCPINNEELTSYNQNAVYMKNWTEVVLFVAYGQPMSASTSTLVTTTNANIDIIQTETYEFKKVQNNTSNFVYSATGFGTASLVYNQGSGAATVPVLI